MEKSESSFPWDNLNSKKEKIVIPIPKNPDLESVVYVAGILGMERNAELVLVKPVVVPEQTSLDSPHISSKENRKLSEARMKLKVDMNINATAKVIKGHRLSDIIFEAVDLYNPTAIVMEPFHKSEGLLRRDVMDKIVTEVETDIFVVNTVDDISEASSILLAVSGGPHSGLVANIGGLIAQANSAEVEVVHIVEDEKDKAKGEEYVEEALSVIEEEDGVEVKTNVLVGDVAERIIDEEKDFDLTVIGVPTRSILQRLVYGSVSKDVQEKTENVVMVGHNSRDT